MEGCTNGMVIGTIFIFVLLLLKALIKESSIDRKDRWRSLN